MSIYTNIQFLAQKDTALSNIIDLNNYSKVIHRYTDMQEQFGADFWSIAAIYVRIIIA